MPFSSFRDRLGSSSKHERSLQQPVAQPSVPASDGTESITTTRTSSTGDSSSSTAVQALMTQPLSADPVQFVQDAITPFFTYNPKHDTVPLDDVLEFHVPRYFAPQYRHNFNLMNTDVGGWINRTRIVRQNCKRTRIRFIKSLVDTSERQSMQLALVSLQLEIVISVPHREEDIRLHGHGIWKIEHGKLIQAMVVVDLYEASSNVPEIPACVIA